VAGLLLVIFLLAVSTESRNIWMFFNSDTLYISSLYRDLFVDGTGLEGWHLNGAPNFFPEWILYMGLMWVLKGTALTSFVYSILQFLLMMFLTQKFLKMVDPEVPFLTLFLVNSCYLLLILSPLFGDNLTFPFQLLISGYHGGYFLNILLVLITGFHYIRKGSIWALILTGLLALLASVSDRLFLVGYVAPLLVLSLLSMFEKRYRLRFILLIALVLLSSYLGLRLFRWMADSKVIYFYGTHAKMFVFENMATSFGNLFEHMAHIIVHYPLQRWLVLFPLLFVLLAPLYLIRYLGPYLKGRLEPLSRFSYSLVLFLWISSIAVFITPAVNGYYLGAAHIRYNYPALLMGSAGFFYLLVNYLKGLKRFPEISRYTAMLVSAGFLLVLFITGMRHDIRSGAKEFTNHYPEKSRILDELKEAHDLKYGIANYWHAKHATTFSKKGVRVYSVHDVDLKPYYHVINEHWYHEGGKGKHADPVFNFIYGDTGWGPKDRMQEIFGQNMDTIYNKGGAMVIKLPEFTYSRKPREIVLLHSREEKPSENPAENPAVKPAENQELRPVED
jgi:hypothetical protein